MPATKAAAIRLREYILLVPTAELRWRLEQRKRPSQDQETERGQLYFKKPTRAAAFLLVPVEWPPESGGS